MDDDFSEDSPVDEGSHDFYGGSAVGGRLSHRNIVYSNPSRSQRPREVLTPTRAKIAALARLPPVSLNDSATTPLTISKDDTAATSKEDRFYAIAKNAENVPANTDTGPTMSLDINPNAKMRVSDLTESSSDISSLSSDHSSPENQPQRRHKPQVARGQHRGRTLSSPLINQSSTEEQPQRTKDRVSESAGLPHGPNTVQDLQHRLKELEMENDELRRRIKRKERKIKTQVFHTLVKCIDDSGKKKRLYHQKSDNTETFLSKPR